MVTLLFILTVAAVAAITVFLETKEDELIIKSSDPNKDKEGWKLYGARKQGGELIIITGLSSMITGSLWTFLMLPILGLVYSICHDCGVSYRLGKGLFYLGTGKWDSEIAKIFQSGLGWFIFKMFLLIIISGSYFSLST